MWIMERNARGWRLAWFPAAGSGEAWEDVALAGSDTILASPEGGGAQGDARVAPRGEGKLLAVVDGRGRAMRGALRRLRLLAAKELPGGVVWLRYAGSTAQQ